jgi:nitrate/nitrite transport system ATP-binding protein
MKKYLEIWRLKKQFPAPGGGNSVVVDEFTLDIGEGEFVCVIGHSGCGKSTVLSIIAGLLDANGGDVVLAGREVRGPGTDRGVVFQSPCLLHWLTALDNVRLAVDQAFPKESSERRRQIALEYLGLVGLADSVHKRPAELSLGMRQRVGLARAFALSPKLLLLDEPFGMLDVLTRYELEHVLLDLWSHDKKTAFMVTHDVDEALFLSDRIVMMTSGPAAKVGDILTVPFARPRDRASVLGHPEYFPLRDRLIDFLERQAPVPRGAELVDDRELSLVPV